jgi:cysteinyl-tRNA synthetase
MSVRFFVCGPTVFLTRHRYRSPVFGFLVPVSKRHDEDTWVTAEVQRRDRLRRERRFTEADEIRERLREDHVVVEDTGASSRWYRQDGTEVRT